MLSSKDLDVKETNEMTVCTALRPQQRVQRNKQFKQHVTTALRKCQYQGSTCQEQLAFFVLHRKFPRARATDPEDYMRVRLIVWIVRRVCQAEYR